MATYNAASYLEESLMSVSAQVFQDYEFYIIDDHSTDATVEIVHRHASMDSRIRLLENEINLGVGETYLKLLALATGDLIAQMGQDDRWDPNFLAAAVEHLNNHPENTAVFSKVNVIDGSGNDIAGTALFSHERLHTLSREEWMGQLIVTNFLCAATSVFRRSSIREWTTLGANDQFQDWNTWQHLSLLGGFDYLPEVTCDYRIHGKNMSLGARSPGQIRVELAQTRRQMLEDPLFAQFILSSDDPDRRFRTLLEPYLRSVATPFDMNASLDLLYALRKHEIQLGSIPGYRSLLGALFWTLGAPSKARRYFGGLISRVEQEPSQKYLISACEWRYLLLIVNPQLKVMPDFLVRPRRWRGVMVVKVRVTPGKLPWISCRLDRTNRSFDRLLELHLESHRQTLRQKVQRVWAAIQHSKGRIFVRYLRERVLANES